ncbi:unnamed protein product [Ilex paraguariensis]|uniref:Uncharacterized protein n=1 Tax=Ilex paraguariensis TaxID=185542 RepID=A0ABC8RED0_9AQUA
MQEEKLRKGPWLEEEDEILTATVALLGERRWDALAKASGLSRSGKSCRLRWMNYLRPNLKHGQISAEEQQIILQLHELWGNKWSRIAQRLPGRTDNEIKNYWKSNLRKKAQVHEQETFGGLGNKAKQNLLIPECERVTPRTHNGDFTSGKDCISGTDYSSDTLEPLDFAFLNSPYEVRLSDWISCWSSEKSEIMQHQWHCCSLDLSCSCYTAWISKDSDDGLWDSLDSIWDLDYSKMMID